VRSIQITDPKELPDRMAVSAVAIPTLLKGAEVWASLSTYMYVLMCVVEE